MARTTRYGIRDVWLANDGTLLIARGDRVLVQRADAAPHPIDVPAETIVPSLSQPRALVASDRDLFLINWADDITATPIGNPDRYLLPTAFTDDCIYVGSGTLDGIARCQLEPGLPVLSRAETVWPVRIHQTAADRIWVMGSTLGAAHYDVFSLPELEPIESGDVDHGIALRSADKLALKSAHIGDVVDVAADSGKQIPLEHVIEFQVPPLSTRPVCLVESSVDRDNRIIAAGARYLAGPDWSYPLDHSLDVVPRFDARQSYAAVATGSADSGFWAVVDLDTGEELGVRSRPLSDVPCVRLCGDKLAAAWIDGAIDVVALPR